MLVYFLRHAEAEPYETDDYSRKLTAKGLEQSERVGKFCVRAGLVPGVVVASPVVRAWRTAEIVAAKLGVERVVEGAWLACGMRPDVCVRELSKLSGMDGSSEGVMVVGHEPDFSEAIGWLVGVADAASLRVRKASLTGVDISSFEQGGGRLEFLVAARLM